MELKDFVKSALVEVVEAVSEAQMDLIEKRAMINPKIYVDNITKTQGQSNLHLKEGTGSPHRTLPVYHAVQNIDFDVAVTISDTTKTGGGGRISVIALSLGGEASDEMQTTSVSRIKFSVPILFPN